MEGYSTEFRIGKRNFKTSLAVFLSVLISQALKLEYPFFAAIAAIITMENSVINTFIAGKNRLLGTLLGALVGIPLVAVSPNNALVCGLGTLLVIFLCSVLNWKKSVSIAGVVLMSVLLSLGNRSPLQYGFGRVLATLLGIIIAVIVNYTILPPNPLKTVEHEIKALSESIFRLLNTMFRSDNNKEMEKLQSIITKTTCKLNNYINLHELDNETRFEKKVIEKLNLAKSITSDLDVVFKLHGECHLSEQNLAELMALKISSMIQANEHLSVI
jgi:uncharacterized membrane protein YgaE (UPF0421/DUF939 family)